MKDNYQFFFASIIFHLVLPLMPLIFEMNYTGYISERSLTMIASIYAFTIAVSSRNVITLAIGIIIGFLNAGNYGSTIKVINEVQTLPGRFDFLSLSAFWLILIIFIIHSTERYARHVLENEEFVLLKKRK